MTTRAAADVPAASIYNRVFWISYAANAAAVAANALTFRFAELVNWLGGTESTTGRIAGIGVIGALAMRLVLGPAIDRFGVRRLWIGGAVLIVASCGTFWATTELTWKLYAVRVVFDVSLAIVFTCSIVHIQNLVPPGLRTEVIASLGSSGFVGMVGGSLLGDAILRAVPEERLRFQVLFGTACAFALAYAVLAWIATRRDVHIRPHHTPSAPVLLARYWPGMVVAAAMMIGTWFTVFSVFLTRFATHLGLRGIGTFFVAYCSAAFAFRLMVRNWDQTIGRHRMILLGLGSNAVGCLLLTAVSREWHFVLPAVFSGFGHALLFPAVVSLGAGSFPREYRGTGTTLVLGFTEVGRLIFAPLLGAIIDRYGFAAMFGTVAATMCVTALTYRLTAARRPDVDHHPTEHAVDGHSAGGGAVHRPGLAESAACVVVQDSAGDAATDGEQTEDEVPVALPFPNVGSSA
jgi:MFS family permease